MRWGRRLSREARRRRAAFDREVERLVGCTVRAVHYWDVQTPPPDVARWDFGDWHLAVMGVELDTDRGPVTITWTNRFERYGVEVFHEPIENHLVLGPDGPERVGPNGPDPWSPILGGPVRQAVVTWDLADARPSTELPTSVRLGFDAGSVRFVAAYPPGAPGGSAFVGGDEILVVFSDQAMHDLGLGHAASDV